MQLDKNQYEKFVEQLPKTGDLLSTKDIINLIKATLGQQ